MTSKQERLKPMSAGRFPGQKPGEGQDEAWHLRRLTLWRMSLTPIERIRVNSGAYRMWRAGQVNHARALAARREARLARQGQ